MTDTPAPSTPGKSSPRQELAVVVGIVFVLVAIPLSYVIGTDYFARRRTSTIITTIGTGLELCIRGRGGPYAVPLDFAYLKQEFADEHILADLHALQAIDEQNRCFVDAWGRPLILRAKPRGGPFEVISSGPDGLPGTSDDLR